MRHDIISSTEVFFFFLENCEYGVDPELIKKKHFFAFLTQKLCLLESKAVHNSWQRLPQLHNWAAQLSPAKCMGPDLRLDPSFLPNDYTLEAPMLTATGGTVSQSAVCIGLIRFTKTF